MTLYAIFTDYQDSLLVAPYPPTDVTRMTNPFSKTSVPAKNLLEVQSLAFASDQTLNIGSQGTGSGAGRITFDPLEITRLVDPLSKVFFVASCTGTPWAFVDLLLTKDRAGGGGPSPTPVAYEGYRFGLAAVEHIERSTDGSESTVEKITFEYGGLLYGSAVQRPDGTYAPFTSDGWNRIRNVRWDGSKIS